MEVHLTDDLWLLLLVTIQMSNTTQRTGNSKKKKKENQEISGLEVTFQPISLALLKKKKSDFIFVIFMFS